MHRTTFYSSTSTHSQIYRPFATSLFLIPFTSFPSFSCFHFNAVVFHFSHLFFYFLGIPFCFKEQGKEMERRKNLIYILENIGLQLFMRFLAFLMIIMILVKGMMMMMICFFFFFLLHSLLFHYCFLFLLNISLYS